MSLKINPNYPEAFFNKWIGLIEQRKFERASEAFNIAIKSDSNYTQGLFNIVNDLKFKKKFEEAI